MRLLKYGCPAVLILLLLINALPATAQNVPSLSYEELKSRMQNSEAQVQIVNFWATWCKPCIKELPYFESVHNKYTKDEVEILLVSLDFSREKAEEFKMEREVKCEIIYLDETDHNKWISNINEDWSGAIPATLIHRTDGNKSRFYAQQFHQGELEDEIQKFLK